MTALAPAGLAETWITVRSSGQVIPALSFMSRLPIRLARTWVLASRPALPCFIGT
jgi:hypothetical protein